MNLGYFTLFPSKKVPERIFIQAIKGKIVICITENFLLGAALQKHANLPLIGILVTKMASNLERKCQNCFAVPFVRGANPSRWGRRRSHSTVWELFK